MRGRAKIRHTADLFVAEDAQIEDVDEWIALVAFVEIDLTADRRDADAVSVMRNAGDDTGEESAIRFHIGAITSDRAETQRVQREDGPRGRP